MVAPMCVVEHLTSQVTPRDSNAPHEVSQPWTASPIVPDSPHLGRRFTLGFSTRSGAGSEASPRHPADPHQIPSQRCQQTGTVRATVLFASVSTAREGRTPRAGASPPACSASAGHAAVTPKLPDSTRSGDMAQARVVGYMCNLHRRFTHFTADDFHLWALARRPFSDECCTLNGSTR